MADTARPISFLPSIKCSDCGVEIEISKMADHICAGGPAEPEPAPVPVAPPKSTKRFFDRAASSIRAAGNIRSSNASSVSSKSGRMGPPPSIDSNAANKPFVQRSQVAQDPLTPNSNPNTSRSPSPSFLRSPSSFWNQHSPVQRAYSPTTPDDSLRPVTPDPPSRLATPSPTHDYPESDPSFAPLSPRPGGSGNVFSRMNMIAPGPFNAKEKKTTLRPEAAAEDRSRSESSHRRTPTLSSLRSSSKSRNSSRSSNDIGHGRQASMASSSKSRNSIRSNGLPAPAEAAEAPPAKRAPPPRPARPDSNVDAFIEHLQGQANQPSLAGLGMRAQASPIQKDGDGTANKAAISLPRRPSEKVPPPPPKSRSQKGSISETPEWWDGPKDAEAPSAQHQRKASAAHENAKRFPRRTSSRNISLKDLDLGPKPPVPQLEVRARGSHAPSDSASSEGSGASTYDVRSSRSSPPTSAGTSPINGPFKPYRPFDMQQMPSSLNVSRPGTSTGPPPEAQWKAPNASQQDAPEELDAPLSPPHIPRLPDAPESPMDPAIQRGLFTPSRPSDASALPEIQSVVKDEEPAPAPAPPAPAQEEEQIKPVSHTRTASLGKKPGVKGNCRGCGEVIVGKSVKAADGRLTGRWHKQCFVCRTCHSPFQTADFYVIDNHPYCGHHYHQLNGSLCRSCNYGIEGQYLETERRLKYHPRCFGCDTCRMPLRDDYFEVMGRAYCERHAWHAARQANGGPRGNMLAPGDPRRNPERRRTRLMMM